MKTKFNDEYHVFGLCPRKKKRACHDRAYEEGTCTAASSLSADPAWRQKFLTRLAVWTYDYHHSHEDRGATFFYLWDGAHMRPSTISAPMRALDARLSSMQVGRSRYRIKEELPTIQPETARYGTSDPTNMRRHEDWILVSVTAVFRQ